MSYLQIDLGGKMRGLKFNQLAIEIISTYNDLESNTSFLYAMIYGGLRGNTYVKREEANYTFEEVCDWVDAMENKEEIVAKVTATLTETNIWQTLVKQGQKLEDDKKKV
jgi:hypothetical protein